MDLNQFERELYKRRPDLKGVSELNKLKHEISGLIFTCRVKAGMSQEMLAKESKMLQPSVARIEGGASFPSFISLFKIAMALRKKIRISLEDETEDVQTVSETVSTPSISEPVLSFFQLKPREILLTSPSSSK